MARDLKLERLWRDRVREHLRSSLSVAEFCRRQGLPVSSFYFWRRVLGHRDQANTKRTREGLPESPPVRTQQRKSSTAGTARRPAP